MTGERSFWAEQAWVSGPSTPQPELSSRVRIDVADGRVTGVHPDAGPRPDDVQLSGVVFPGFANTHSHAFHRALRGRTHHHPGGSFWGWREGMYALAERLTPDSYYQLARAVYAEMVLAGFTAVGEFHYLHHAPGGAPYTDPNAMGHALCQAAADAGIRLTLLDTCYLQGGIGAELEGTQLRFGDGTAERWIDRVERLRTALGRDEVTLGAAVHSVRAVPEPAIRTVAEWSGRAGVPLHVHLSEQVAENDACLAAYGRTPTRLLADAGALGPATTAIHATHLTVEDVRLLGESRTTVCGCPTTEQDLADGISPMGALASAGCAVCLGSDQHAVVDPFVEARMLEMHERLAGGRRGRFGPADLVTAMTGAGHGAVGRAADGRIAPGTAADLVAVRTGSVRTAGSDPAQLVLSASSADVGTVVVGGRLVVDDGQHVLGDIGTLLRDSLRAV